MTHNNDDLILAHRNLVRALAVKVRKQYSSSADLEELVSLGMVGLVEAAQRFDPARGTRFSTFAYHRVRGAIIDGVVGTAATFGPGARDEMTRALTGPDLRSDGEPLEDLIDRKGGMLRVLRAMSRLPPRLRYVLERRYWDERELTQIGVELGVSKSRSSRIHAAALRQLRTQMAAA